jgi:hypothetical protein
MLLTRKTFLTAAATGAASLALPGTALAQRAGYRWEIFSAGFVKWEVPTAWVTKIDGNVLQTKPGDGALLRLEFVGIGNPNANLAQIVKEELGKRINGSHLTEPEKPIAQNGLTGSMIRGEGTSNNPSITGPIEFKCFALLNASRKGMLGLAFWKPGQYSTHQGYLDVVFNSIQPT